MSEQAGQSRRDRAEAVPAVLAPFAGRWQMARRIEAGGARAGRFDGEAILVPAAGGLGYREAGELRLATGAAMRAERRHLWRAEGARIAVLFADGRFFYAFDPAAPRPEARHDCPPDLYRVAYDFTGWPEWQTVWRVRGPGKAYRLITRYRPLRN